ncbi:hypothetical protein [Leptolyngbya sp. PCC 6406]|nr:hypothetical protein [Leptolyngbya sp. PCC 6406]
MTHASAHNARDRQQRIHELRHRLRYTNSPLEQEQVRTELEFWMRHR